MLRKSISVVIFLLFLLSSFKFIVSSNETNKSFTIYVDDDGGADYNKIQDAINAVSNRDTIFVYEGIYDENIILNKSINLIGENKETTIINGNSVKDVIIVTSEKIIIKGFTIRNSGNKLSQHSKKIWKLFEPYDMRHWCAVSRLIKTKIETGKFDVFTVQNWL